MKKIIKKVISIFMISSMIFVGCGTNESEDISNNKEDKFTIVTSFYPLYVSTINIVKDIPNVEVINMTKPQTGCLHDYQLTPQDLKTLEKVDAFVINGANMESFLDKVIESQKDLKIIDASEGITLLKSDVEHNHDHDHEDEADHDVDHSEEEADGHDHGEYNGHVWVSIDNNIKQVENITNGLAKLDVDNATKLNQNSQDYIAKLKDLKSEFNEGLKNISTRDIIAFHESIAYLADEFNLNLIEVIEVEPGTEPGPKERQKIIEEIKEHGVKSIFTEPQYNTKVAESIASESGSKVYSLDPVVTGDSSQNVYNDYIDKMKENLEVLKEALK